jgi:glycosyltransferase involved in cell wall biosynthesis
MDDVRTIDIAVAGKFHAFHLASALARIGALRDLYSAHRSVRPPAGVKSRQFHNRIEIAAWAQLSSIVPLGYSDGLKLRIFDRWLSRNLRQKRQGVLHSWNGNSLATFKALQGTGWLLCVERSCPHNQFQYDLLVEEGKAIGVPHRQDPRDLASAIEELHLADVIVAPSTYSAASYQEPALKKKLRINPLGANVRYLERAQSEQGLRVLMVGNQFLRKGTHYLIEAFKKIDDPNARLWIRGDVPGDYRSRINDRRITIFPSLLPDKLHRLYRSANVFVQPSIDEGFGMTVLEALGYGLPVVVTEHVGARDLLTSEVSISVPIRSPDALVEAIMSARTLPGPTFDAARRRIIEANSWQACARRMLDQVYVR